MGQEIERKYLINDADWHKTAIRGSSLRQAYLARNDGISVRVRIRDERHATLTIKSRSVALQRHEFEYAIPLEDAAVLLEQRIGRVIEKTRYEIPTNGLKWEIDVFHGVHSGLIIAEIELQHEHQTFERPSWLGREVTGDARYYNSSLATDQPAPTQERC